MKIRLFIRILCIITICLNFLSCHKNSSESSDFLIKVDSIKAPNEISSGTAFDIVFYGTIGFNGCVSFKTFNRIDKKMDITIEAVGNYKDINGTCPDVLVSLDGRKFNITINIPGIYRIVIKEPDNLLLVKQVIVK
jgi:hypothetical protein